MHVRFRLRARRAVRHQPDELLRPPDASAASAKAFGASGRSATPRSGCSAPSSRCSTPSSACRSAGCRTGSQRRKILAAGVFVWSLLTALSGVARNFSQLIVARLGVGVGEATCSPASTSLIGDLFPTDACARAPSPIWMLGLPLGLGLANGAGGWILQNWGWRNAFYIAAVPGILCAVAALGDARAGARHARGARGRRAAPRRQSRTCSCCRFRRCCGSSRRGRCTTSTCTRSARSSRRSSCAFTT